MSEINESLIKNKKYMWIKITREQKKSEPNSTLQSREKYKFIYKKSRMKKKWIEVSKTFVQF